MKLREIRRRKLLTVEELAKQSGLSAATIHKIEQGAWLPSLASIRKMAPVLGVDPMEVEEFKAAIEKDAGKRD